MPRGKDGFLKELQDNQSALSPFVPHPMRHFCYPSGVYYPESEALLTTTGILSATTCDPGLASATSNLQYLPRYLDAMNISDTVFESWVTGAASLLPHRNSKYGEDH